MYTVRIRRYLGAFQYHKLNRPPPLSPFPPKKVKEIKHTQNKTKLETPVSA